MADYLTDVGPVFLGTIDWNFARVVPISTSEDQIYYARGDPANQRTPPIDGLRCAGDRRRPGRIHRGRPAGAKRPPRGTARKGPPSALSYRRVAAARQPADYGTVGCRRPSPRHRHAEMGGRVRFLPRRA